MSYKHNNKTYQFAINKLKLDKINNNNNSSNNNSNNNNKPKIMKTIIM